MSECFLCKWHHDSPQDPIVLCEELDDERYDTRRLRIFADGRCEYYGSRRPGGSLEAATHPVPELKEIDAEEEFDLLAVSANQFESLWKAAIADDNAKEVLWIALALFDAKTGG